jgi:phage baseplate assembly protein W
MAFRKSTLGVDFPFRDSEKGDFLRMTTTPEEEIKADLIHLLLTRKGSRYMLPSFGTNLYQYIFENLTDETLGKIENEINDAVEKFIPNLKIDTITILKFGDEGFDLSGDSESHAIKIRLGYSIQQKSFEFNDNITIGF